MARCPGGQVSRSSGAQVARGVVDCLGPFHPSVQVSEVEHKDFLALLDRLTGLPFSYRCARVAGTTGGH